MVKAAEFSYRDARDTVVLAVGANYLLVIAQESRLEAAQAELKTAEALYQLAEDQEAAGLVPNIDTLRARVQLQAQQETVIEVENALEKQRIALARVIGLPVQQKFRLVDRVPHSDLPGVNIDGAVQLALETRSDYKAVQAQVRAAELRRSAAWKGYLPSVGSLRNLRSARLHSRCHGAQLLRRRRTSISQSFRAEECRLTLLPPTPVERAPGAGGQPQGRASNRKWKSPSSTCEPPAARLDVAKTGLDFAQQALDQSQDRFAAGVTNNVEVIQAQQQLASANDRYITACLRTTSPKCCWRAPSAMPSRWSSNTMAGNSRASAFGRRAHTTNAATREQPAGVAESQAT